MIVEDSWAPIEAESQILKIRADKVDGVFEEIAELKKSLGLT